MLLTATQFDGGGGMGIASAVGGNMRAATPFNNGVELNARGGGGPMVNTPAPAASTPAPKMSAPTVSRQFTAPSTSGGSFQKGGAQAASTLLP